MERILPIVRQAVIQDLPRLVPLFDAYRMYFKQEARPEAVAQFLFEKFEHRESVVYVVESGDGTFVGFARLYPIFSSLSLERVWLLNDFFVAEAFRGKAYGGLLLDAVKQYAVLTRAKGIELSVEHVNVEAWQFYERRGFRWDEEFRWYFHKV